MRRLKFLLRPSWIVLALLVVAFAFLCFSVLAPWQLGKNTSTEHRNQLIADSIEADPVPVESLVGADGTSPDDEWRQVTATGSYVPDSDALVRLRSIESQPAYEVLTPFRLEDGRALLVNRGYVRPVLGTQAPPVDPAPTGEVTLAGRIRMPEGVAPGRDPMVEGDVRQVYTINPGQVGDFVGVDLVDTYLQLEPDQPGGLGTIPLPQLDAGPYLSYGLQWLAFGIMAPLGLAYFVRAELRERRKEKAGGDGGPEPTPPTDRPEPEGPTPPQKPSSRSASVADPVEDSVEDATANSAGARPSVDDIVLPRGRFRRGPKAPETPLSAADAKLADRYGKRR
ncbi:SURF1 family protein [Rhodococcus triatomae]|uniref:SURF1-like protein n=1 Tax=Rhodococcus triatomae TaxID=300028 RepID=A0A1G8DBR7_9NOCA|nr:SURF1 family protein [Rhodococcus triatomae]QNG18460.1 SURF1 family protein [Rhodococcus triatomae]QNG21871.1 SURF1 family protein [Rhodococcus triatomae]SDH55125.1 Cytochrome oxidase assembly protein ShyY1 [Rhodococcus triatomae]